MKLSGYAAGCSWLATGLKTVLLALASSLVFVPLANAEHFRSAQTVAIESDNATLSKQVNGPSQVTGHLVAKGVGLFKAGSQEQEVVMVTLNGDFQGTANPTQLTNHQVALLSFGDGSTIRLESEGTANGRRGTYKIRTSTGTGRFKGVKVTGSIVGDAFDPALAYVVMEGDYEVQ